MTKLQQINVSKEIDVPVELLFAHLAEHENLQRLFAPAKVRRLTSGRETRNGVGSSRSIRPGPLPVFVETVTAYRENEAIEYRITRGSPLRDHKGEILFERLGTSRSRVTFHIAFKGRFIGAGPSFKYIIGTGVAKGLDELAADPALLTVGTTTPTG